MNKMLLNFGLIALLTGCVTSPARFVESSAPVPQQGYKVIGKEVTGTSTQAWILGLGGSIFPQQPAALRDAMRNAPDETDALVSVSIEEHLFSFIIYTSKTTSVTGIPVKFNK